MNESSHTMAADDTASMLEAERAKASFDVEVLSKLLGADVRRAQLKTATRSPASSQTTSTTRRRIVVGVADV